MFLQMFRQESLIYIMINKICIEGYGATMPLLNSFSSIRLTLVIPGGDAIIILCRKIAISPETNLRWTSDQSVNSSLSVAVQGKKPERSIFLS